ncbi:MAG: hypothetical protein IKO41_21590 [Lachnospiraceae bacterium]|nr:hypothetical protein [Lachnospiraceae bacterium]
MSKVVKDNKQKISDIYLKNLHCRLFIKNMLSNKRIFKAKWPQKDPEHSSQLIQLQRKHGVRSFPVNLEKLKKSQKYLWIANKRNIKIVIEYNKSCVFLVDKLRRTKYVVKHTNITGGKKAFIGGQIIINNENFINMDFASGRYGPKTKNEFDYWYNEINNIFKKIGYNIFIEEWDADAGCPCRIDC